MWRYSPSPGSRHMHSDITRQHHPPPPGCPPLAVSSRLFPKSSIVRCIQDLLYNLHRPIVVELLTPKLQAPTRHRLLLTASPLIAAWTKTPQFCFTHHRRDARPFPPPAPRVPRQICTACRRRPTSAHASLALPRSSLRIRSLPFHQQIHLARD